ncbi:MAG TPA: hypothetical protein VKB34_16650, partial [Povalibacter sp.]|nr:hypothetical protein [Povalibacter sp.]
MPLTCSVRTLYDAAVSVAGTVGNKRVYVPIDPGTAEITVTATYIYGMDGVQANYILMYANAAETVWTTVRNDVVANGGNRSDVINLTSGDYTGWNVIVQLEDWTGGGSQAAGIVDWKVEITACQAGSVPPGPTPPVPTVRTVSLMVTMASTVLNDVISARGEVSADSGWPTCSVFVKDYPYVDNDPNPITGVPLDEEETITVVAGAGNNVTRFTGRVRRFRPSAFPRAIEIVATGTLAYANEWAPKEDIRFGFDFFGDSGATDEELIQYALDQVPGVSYSSGNIDGTGTTLAVEPGVWAAFDWKAGTTAWSYIQNVDRATLFRTYQTRDGTIRRVQMIGHPDSTEDFTLANEDILEGASGDRNTEQTRNCVEVKGHDYGTGTDITLGSATGTNSFQGDGSVA